MSKHNYLPLGFVSTSMRAHEPKLLYIRISNISSTTAASYSDHHTPLNPLKFCTDFNLHASTPSPPPSAGGRPLESKSTGYAEDPYWKAKISNYTAHLRLPSFQPQTTQCRPVSIIQDDSKEHLKHLKLAQGHTCNHIDCSSVQDDLSHLRVMSPTELRKQRSSSKSCRRSSNL
jgi:hypothetical protein